MKCQTLSPVKNKKNICNLLSADLANKVKINQESQKKKKNTLRLSDFKNIKNYFLEQRRKVFIHFDRMESSST